MADCYDRPFYFPALTPFIPRRTKAFNVLNLIIILPSGGNTPLHLNNTFVIKTNYTCTYYG